MGATMNANGTMQQRKTLANQLDRLDGILDVLGDGLNEAVAGAVEQAVGAAVSSAVASVLTELLTNPAVISRLRDVLAQASPPVAGIAVPVPPSPSYVSYTDRMRDHFQTAKEKLASLAISVRKKVSAMGVKVKGWLGTLSSKAGACLRMLKPFRQSIMVAASVGVAFGMTAFFAGRYFAAVVGCVAGFATTLGIQAAVAFRRLMGLGTSI